MRHVQRIALVLAFVFALGRSALATYQPGNTPSGPYSFCYALTANATISNNTSTNLAGWTSIFDNGSWHVDATNNLTFIAPANGRYLVVFQTTWKASTNTTSTGAYLQRARKNGTLLLDGTNLLTIEQWSANNTEFIGTPWVAVVNLAANDTLIFTVAHLAGSNAIAVGTGAMGSNPNTGGSGSTYVCGALLASQ